MSDISKYMLLLMLTAVSALETAGEFNFTCPTTPKCERNYNQLVTMQKFNNNKMDEILTRSGVRLATCPNACVSHSKEIVVHCDGNCWHEPCTIRDSLTDLKSKENVGNVFLLSLECIHTVKEAYCYDHVKLSNRIYYYEVCYLLNAAENGETPCYD